MGSTRLSSESGRRSNVDFVLLNWWVVESARICDCAGISTEENVDGGRRCSPIPFFLFSGLLRWIFSRSTVYLLDCFSRIPIFRLGGTFIL